MEVIVKFTANNEYTFAFHKQHEYNGQSHTDLQNISTVDIAVVKDDKLPHFCLKKGRTTKMNEGNNGRGVSLTVVSATNKTQCVNHSLQLIIPLKLKDTQQSNKNIEIIDNDTSEPSMRSDETRYRRVAAVKANTL